VQPVDGSQRNGEDDSKLPVNQNPDAMLLWPVIAVACVLFIAWTLIPGVRHWRYRRAIRERSAARAAWEAEFRDAMPKVEQVLTIFCDAFLFDRRHCFCFRPDDRVMDVYKGTTGPVADEMQLEELGVQLERGFGVKLAESFGENTTLRDIVALAVAGDAASDEQDMT
jgi:hypothetical protein